MFFDEATTLSGSRDLVQEAIGNAQEELTRKAQSLTDCPSPESKKKCLADSKNSDDPLLDSFYERDWRMKQSPPLPIKEWSSTFPHLMLLNNTQIAHTLNRNGEETQLERNERPKSAEESRNELRSKLKERLRKQLSSIQLDQSAWELPWRIYLQCSTEEKESCVRINTKRSNRCRITWRHESSILPLRAFDVNEPEAMSIIEFGIMMPWFSIKKRTAYFLLKQCKES